MSDYPKGWTCNQSYLLRNALQDAKEECRKKAEREDYYSDDARLFRTLEQAFRMLEARHPH